MDDKIEYYLKKIIDTYGNEVIEDTKRLKASLMDLCPLLRKEIFLITTSAACISKMIINSEGDNKDKLGDKLIKILCDNYSLDYKKARWVIEIWADVLEVECEFSNTFADDAYDKKLIFSLVTELAGHSEPVNNIVFQENDNYLFSCSNDGTVRLWDISNKTGKILVAMPNMICSMDYSIKNKVIYTNNNNINIYDYKLQRNISTLSKHWSFVTSTAFSSDGNLIASAGNDKFIRVWNTLFGAEKLTIWTGEKTIYSLIFIKENTLLASVGSDRKLKVWDMEDGKLVNAYKAHSNRIYSIAASPTNELIATAGMDKVVKVWNSEFEQVYELNGHSDSVLSLSFSRDGRYLASGGADNIIRIWNLITGKEAAVIQDQGESITILRYSPKRDILASGSYDNKIKIWSY